MCRGGPSESFGRQLLRKAPGGLLLAASIFSTSTHLPISITRNILLSRPPWRLFDSSPYWRFEVFSFFNSVILSYFPAAWSTKAPATCTRLGPFYPSSSFLVSSTFCGGFITSPLPRHPASSRRVSRPRPLYSRSPRLLDTKTWFLSETTQLAVFPGKLRILLSFVALSEGVEHPIHGTPSPSPTSPRSVHFLGTPPSTQSCRP